MLDTAGSGNVARGGLQEALAKAVGSQPALLEFFVGAAKEVKEPSTVAHSVA